MNGAIVMATVYTIGSFKVVSFSEKTDAHYAALVSKVQACTAETTTMNTVFGNNKMFIESNSWGAGTKGLPMYTLTVTVK